MHTAFVPNLYKVVDCVEIAGAVVIDCIIGKRGDKVKFFYMRGEEQEESLVSYRTTDKPSHHEAGLLEVSQVFLYGKEVNDCRSVNYNNIHTLTTSATQDLGNKLQDAGDYQAIGG